MLNDLRRCLIPVFPVLLFSLEETLALNSLFSSACTPRSTCLTAFPTLLNPELAANLPKQCLCTENSKKNCILREFSEMCILFLAREREYVGISLLLTNELHFANQLKMTKKIPSKRNFTHDKRGSRF